MDYDTAPSRRDFLKTSSAVAGAALAGSVNIARSAHAAGSDEIKVALIGCGGRGTGAANNCLNVQDNIRLVALADPFADQLANSLRTIEEQHKSKVDVPPERRFVGIDAYQQAIDCGVDLVLLATPPGFRPLHYAAAIQAGKHVFMEKPCCVDAPGFRSLMETNQLADQKGCKVVVGLQRRHDPAYLEGVRRIHDGQIGDLLFLRVYWNGGPIWIRPRQPSWTEMEYQIRNWNVFRWLSGDHIVEQHVHNIDIGLWVKGDHPVEAQGMGGREVRKGKDNGHIFDHHAVEYTFADGMKMFSQCRQMPGTASNVSEAAHGTKGVSNCRAARGVDPFDQEHADLIAAIRGSTPLNDGRHAAIASMTAVLGRMATYSGKVVRWDDAVAKGPSEAPATYALDAAPPVLPDEHGLYDHAAPVPGVYQPY